MALDPRIALQGASWQAPDILGAMRQGQEYRQNQMVMQTARDTAARNAMIRERAATVNPTDRAAVNQFVSMAGPDAAPYLEAWTGGDTMFNSRAAEGRAADKAATEQREANYGQLVPFASQLLGDASPANLARVRGMAEASGFPVEVYDALATSLVDLPPAEQQQALQSFLASMSDGQKALQTFYPARELVNTGGTQVPVNLSPLARDRVSGAPVPVTGALRNTADPRAPQIIQTSGGFGSVTPGEPGFTPVEGPGGAPVMPYDSSPAPAGGGPQDAKTMAAAGLRSTIESLRGYYGALNESGGIVSTDRGAGSNLLASAGASLPGRVIGRTLGTEDQTQRDNIQTAIPMIVASLKDLTGMSAQQMNSNVELQLFLNTVGDPSQSIETVNEALTRFERYVDRVAGAGGGSGAPAGGGANLPPVGAEGSRVRNRGTGVVMVSRGGRWVPE